MSYTEIYETELLRGENEVRPWNMIQEITKKVKSNYKILDVGCGTASKLIKLASQIEYQEIVGIEPNERMRKKAHENIKKSNLSNIFVIDGVADRLPFNNDSFDIVTAMVAPHNTKEVHRVLKQGGYAIIEKVGDRDKWNFKVLFGDDSQGMRGQFGEYSQGDREKEYHTEFSNLFNSVIIENGFWKTYYSIEGLILLFEETPTIRNFDKIIDMSVLQQIEEKYMTERGIETTQNRILIQAEK